jgi:hypothetical protein
VPGRAEGPIQVGRDVNDFEDLVGRPDVTRPGAVRVAATRERWCKKGSRQRLNRGLVWCGGRRCVTQALGKTPKK